MVGGGVFMGKSGKKISHGKNPLGKRLPRELRSEFGKYMVIFLLLTGTIGLVSGFLVADGSMIIAYEESFEKYNIEDGNFCLQEKANRAQRKKIEDFGLTLYDNFYVERELSNGTMLRIFSDRKEVDRVCLMEGELPKAEGEIAIDRMYAQNNQIVVGDRLKSGKKEWKVTGYVALSDYSCLFSDNNDSMFDAVKFGVAVVTEKEFGRFSEDELNYSYAWKYDNPPAAETEEKEISDDLIKHMTGIVKLSDYVPRYLNQAIRFTGEDMGGDKAMMTALLYIIIVIMAFVFGVTISNTIFKEANVIGTLRAMGYTKGELVRHYMAMPILVTMIGAALGNVLGYTIFKDICAGLYYGSYSLPTYVTIWSGEAFVKTTVVPVMLMALINYFVLRHKLSLAPLRFLRRDIRGKKQKRAVRLHPGIPFFARFRLRVIFQNMSNYAVLFIGIVFANLLLMFGLLFPAVLDHYQKEMENNLLCKYQYILSVPATALNEERKLESLFAMMFFQMAVETENKDAEKFTAYTLKTPEDGFYKSEEVILYGVKENSKYITADIPEGTVFISGAYAEKYEVKKGDRIRLKEAFEKKEYDFLVGGIYDYDGALAVFMEQEKLNRTFDLEDDYFSGYFSDTEITDIDEEYIGSVIDLDSLTKISRQLQVSMGSMMDLVNIFAIIMFMVLIYLLSKIIMEKNAQSISMAKILGYRNAEISRLYLIPTFFMVTFFILLSFPLEYEAMYVLFRTVMLSSISGWIPFYVEPGLFVKMFVLGMAAYGAVALFEYQKIKKVPMDEALKNVE